MMRTDPPDVIRTARLRLVPMTPDFLRALIAGRMDDASLVAGFQVPAEIMVPQWVLVMRLRALEENPALQPWLLRSVVLEETGAMVGDIGFHDKPGADHLREFCDYGAEMGYSIAPEHRRRGYAREAIGGMMQWAREKDDVRSFVLSIHPSNEASRALAAAMGFVKVGEHTDEVDGAEDVYLRDE